MSESKKSRRFQSNFVTDKLVPLLLFLLGLALLVVIVVVLLTLFQ